MIISLSLSTEEGQLIHAVTKYAIFITKDTAHSTHSFKFSAGVAKRCVLSDELRMTKAKKTKPSEGMSSQGAARRTRLRSQAEKTQATGHGQGTETKAEGHEEGIVPSTSDVGAEGPMEIIECVQNVCTSGSDNSEIKPVKEESELDTGVVTAQMETSEREMTSEQRTNQVIVSGQSQETTLIAMPQQGTKSKTEGNGKWAEHKTKGYRKDPGIEMSLCQPDIDPINMASTMARSEVQTVGSGSDNIEIKPFVEGEELESGVAAAHTGTSDQEMASGKALQQTPSGQSQVTMTLPAKPNKGTKSKKGKQAKHPAKGCGKGPKIGQIEAPAMARSSVQSVGSGSDDIKMKPIVDGNEPDPGVVAAQMGTSGGEMTSEKGSTLPSGQSQETTTPNTKPRQRAKAKTRRNRNDAKGQTRRQGQRRKTATAGSSSDSGNENIWQFEMLEQALSNADSTPFTSPSMLYQQLWLMNHPSSSKNPHENPPSDEDPPTACPSDTAEKEKLSGKSHPKTSTRRGNKMSGSVLSRRLFGNSASACRKLGRNKKSGKKSSRRLSGKTASPRSLSGSSTKPANRKRLELDEIVQQLTQQAATEVTVQEDVSQPSEAASGSAKVSSSGEILSRLSKDLDSLGVEVVDLSTKRKQATADEGNGNECAREPSDEPVDPSMPASEKHSPKVEPKSKNSSGIALNSNICMVKAVKKTSGAAKNKCRQQNNKPSTSTLDKVPQVNAGKNTFAERRAVSIDTTSETVQVKSENEPLVETLKDTPKPEQVKSKDQPMGKKSKRAPTRSVPKKQKGNSPNTKLNKNKSQVPVGATPCSPTKVGCGTLTGDTITGDTDVKPEVEAICSTEPEAANAERDLVVESLLSGGKGNKDQARKKTSKKGRKPKAVNTQDFHAEIDTTEPKTTSLPEDQALINLKQEIVEALPRKRGRPKKNNPSGAEQDCTQKNAQNLRKVKPQQGVKPKAKKKKVPTATLR